MSSSSGWGDGPPLPSSTARGLSLAGLVLLVLFLAILAGALFPIALLAPAWQLRFGGALINASPVALTGLAMLHLAAALDPEDPLLAGRLRLAAQLAIPAALGFLLLLPLLNSAALRQQSDQAQQRRSQLGTANQQLEALRLAVRQAGSVPELDQRLSALRGPQLEPSDRSLPLPEVRRRVDVVLDRAAGEIARQAAAAPATDPQRLWIEIGRTSFACLALALGFAGLARRHDDDASLLQTLQWRWQLLLHQRRLPRRSRAVATPGDVLAGLAPPEDPSPEPGPQGDR